MKKIPFYFSIDFEDFAYDLCRSIGNPSPDWREEALENSYLTAESFSNRFFNGRKMTFFVTGALARKFPKMIKKFFDNGHEIGCHYNFHDNINRSDRDDFSKNLDIAIESIENSIGEKPLGFRAPNFAINQENTWAYEELAKRFAYDSSYKTSLPLNETVVGRKFNFNGENLHEYYIFGLPIFFGRFALRTGGTYFRLFPAKYTIKAMKKTHEFGHIPLIYLHPYELTLNSDFRVTFKDLKYLSLPKRLYTWVRQIQWSKLGHHSVEKKMEKICDLFEHQGPMNLLLKTTNLEK